MQYFNKFNKPFSINDIMKYKRGSHVGVVLSFLIFITFLFFLYVTVAPAIKIKEDKKFILNYLKIELIKKLSEDLTSITIVIDKTVEEGCVELEDFTKEVLVNSTLIVKDNIGNILEAQISQNNRDLFINRGDNKTDFFKIHVSKEFDEIEEGSMNQCEKLEKDDEGYKIGSIKVTKYLFETKIIELKNLSDYDYDSLKKDLNISGGNEFGFDFIYDNGTIIETKTGETKTNIYIEEIPVQYIDKEANILQGIIRIKVW